MTKKTEMTKEEYDMLSPAEKILEDKRRSNRLAQDKSRKRAREEKELLENTARSLQEQVVKLEKTKEQFEKLIILLYYKYDLSPDQGFDKLLNLVSTSKK